MLVLTRRLNESIVINGDIVITVLEVGRNGQVRLGIEAPRNYQIYRRELWLEIEQENRNALASASGTKAATPPPERSDTPTDEPTPTGGTVKLSMSSGGEVVVIVGVVFGKFGPNEMLGKWAPFCVVVDMVAIKLHCILADFVFE